ncbi:CMRF35-like molecule 5 isoform X2 [Anabas testudineus]|uniref:CMRF35-like molecule 5 isoform X2 n=1 Tax=Anabas testudineus TaxID=64144 RepID=UPI000E45832D|nr:CMRF35-like molecule 5 isoform X2 [Anabas testudineus]
MTFLHIAMLCCFSAVYLKASALLEVSGHVGGEVSILCSASWTTDSNSEHNNMYFCKGICSRDNILIQTERERQAVKQGRYRLEVDRGHGVFNVTITRLKRADAGRYCCGVEKTFNALHQNISLKVVNASTVPPRSPPAATTTTAHQTEAEASSQGSFLSSIEPAALTSPATGKTTKQATTNLTDTTVVIIVSVSLALLVCAVIPLIFYGHWRSNAGQSRREENKGETAVTLQSLEPDADPETSAQDASQYAGIYQALDPQSLD